MEYTITVEVERGYDETVAATREALADNGFGVLTEIDLTATLKAKLGVDVPRQIILGACRPPLAYAALQAEPAVAVLLPCNVVVRSERPGATVVQALDPAFMVSMIEGEQVAEVAADARARIAAALEQIRG
jgi:uncharacterized protein (DUF302 family)